MQHQRENNGSAALARLCQSDVLSVEEERTLFGRLKVLRQQALRLAASDSTGTRRGQSAAERGFLREAAEIRNRIVESNLRLVVSLAKRFAAPDRSLEDLVSDAALPLIRCVDSFDGERGTRFSTYATRALKNFFGKRCRQDGRRRSRSVNRAGLKGVPAAERDELCERLIRAEDLKRLGGRLARLPDRQRTLLAERFGLTGDRRPRTFRELGARHGLSKERARVITSEAMTRLREWYNESLPS